GSCHCRAAPLRSLTVLLTRPSCLAAVFVRIASAAANDTHLSQRLPGESGWQLPLPCRFTPLTDGASDTAFMSCRSLPVPTPYPRPQTTLSSFGISSLMRSGVSNTAPALQSVRNGNSHERVSSVALVLSTSGAPGMRSFSRMESGNSASAMFQSCLSMPGALVGEDGSGARDATPPLPPSPGEVAVQEPSDALPPSSSSDPATVPAVVHSPQAQKLLRSPPRVEVASAAPTSLFSVPRKPWRDTAHTTSYASFRWRKNPVTQQSPGSLAAARSCGCGGRASFSGIAALPTRQRRERLYARHVSEPPRRARGVATIPFGQQSSWPKMSDLHSTSLTLQLSPKAPERSSASLHLDGPQGGSVQGQEGEGNETREAAPQDEQGEPRNFPTQQHPEEQLGEDVDQATRGRRETDAASSPLKEGTIETAVPKAAGESDGASQTTEVYEVLHAEEFAASSVARVTDGPSSVGTPLLGAL
ncbi:uncharacterized protein Tco025E_02307, partial [Trypanosoma conorhini]